jgi:hypothetical protein
VQTRLVQQLYSGNVFYLEGLVSVVVRLHHPAPRDAINRVPTPLDIASLVRAVAAQQSYAHPNTPKVCVLRSFGHTVTMPLPSFWPVQVSVE